MMRPIKFRAWDSEVEGFITSDGTYDSSWFEFSEGVLKAFAIHGMTSGSIHEPPEPNCEELETVQQYTGLKDRNGVEIYEGDIVLGIDGTESHIVWDDDVSAFCWDDNSGEIGLEHAYDWALVVGNIYEGRKAKGE